jgi:hypothetical protein
VDGRGVRRARALPVLRRPHRRGHRHGHAGGAPARVRVVRRVRREEVPDPGDPATFERSKLTRARDGRIEGLYRDLLRVRRELPRGRAGPRAIATRAGSA